MCILDVTKTKTHENVVSASVKCCIPSFSTGRITNTVQNVTERTEVYRVLQGHSYKQQQVMEKK